LGLIFASSLFAFTLHKEYYSLTKIHYNAKSESLEITMRLFTDDMERALSEYYKKPLELGTKIEIADADKLLELYLSQQFKVRLNTIDRRYKFIGKEFEKDAIYLYLEVADVKNIKELGVTNTILTILFLEQENIIKINVNNQHKSMILTQENNKDVVFFE